MAKIELRTIKNGFIVTTENGDEIFSETLQNALTLAAFNLNIHQNIQQDLLFDKEEEIKEEIQKMDNFLAEAIEYSKHDFNHETYSEIESSVDERKKCIVCKSSQRMWGELLQKNRLPFGRFNGKSGIIHNKCYIRNKIQIEKMDNIDLVHFIETGEIINYKKESE